MDVYSDEMITVQKPTSDNQAVLDLLLEDTWFNQYHSSSSRHNLKTESGILKRG